MIAKRTSRRGRASKSAPAGKPAGKLTRSANAASRLRLEAAANRSGEKDVAQALKAAKAEKAKLRAALAKPREAVARFMKKDPAYSSFQQEWGELVTQVARAGAVQNEEVRNARAGLMERHRSLFEKAYIGANVDSRAVAAAVRSILSPAAERILPLEFANVLVVPPLPEALPAPAEFELSLPFHSADQHTSSGVLGFTIASTFADNGSVHAYADGTFDAYAYATAVVGDVVAVPAGFKKLKITAFAPSLSYEVQAFGLANVSSAGVRMVVELTDPNSDVQRKTDLVARVLAPLLWFAQKQGSGERQITRTFRIPNSGGDFLVRAGVQALVWSAGLFGACSASTTAIIDRISIEALP